MRAIQTVDFSDFTNWKSGCYHWVTGKYMDYPSRLCLNDYIICQSGERYAVKFSNKDFHVLIREVDAELQLISSYVLQFDSIIITNDKTHCLAIGIYNPSNSKLSYEDYVNLFADGLNISIHVENISEESPSNPVPIEVIKEQAVEEVDFSKLSSWRSGCYSWTTGVYESNKYRICLDYYKTFQHAHYKVKIDNPLFHLLIREMDQNKKLMKTHDLKDGSDFFPSKQTKYLAIGIYRTGWETNLTFASYVVMFQNGFYAGLKAVESTDIPLGQPTTLTGVLKNMLESGDMTSRDISKFKVDYISFYQIYKNLIQGECYLAYQAYYSMYPTTTKIEGTELLKTVTLKGADLDFKARYVKMKKVVGDALSLMKPEMKEVEKALILHDYVVEHTSYDTSAVGAYTAVGALVNGRGVCDGYTLALNLLLHEAGITAYFIVSTKMNHSWTMVSLDGELYHIDATWDDTRSRTWNSTDHIFFIRNDNEFKNPSNGNNSHHSWISYSIDAISNSKRYNNWFVHDVVGKILYKDGYWYYGDDNKLMKVKIDGSQLEEVATELTAVWLESIEDGLVTYNVNGRKKTV